jgi:hypothetical protein
MAGAGDSEAPADWPPGTPDRCAPYGQSDEEELILGRGPGRSRLLLQRIAQRFPHPPLAMRLCLVAIIGAVTYALLLGSGLLGNTTHHRPSNGADSITHSDPDPSVRSRSEEAVIIAKALNAAPLMDYTRSTAHPGECVVVPPDASPTQALAAAAHRALPEFRIRDLGRTLDQSTGLCALDLRADDRTGSALIIEVVPPSRAKNHPFAAINVEVTSDGTTASSIASTRTRDGWSITVAAVGPIAHQPSSAAMVALTEDASLRW